MANDDMHTALSMLRTLAANDDMRTALSMLRTLAMHCTLMARQTRQNPDASDAVLIMGMHYDFMAEVYVRVVAQLEREDKDGPT